MVIVFWLVSSGASLRVTFVPAAIVTFALLVYLRVDRTVLAPPGSVLPAYLLVLGYQGLHFAEEYGSGFWRAFPELYGGSEYDPTTFVWFNMAAYAVFGAAAVGAFVLGVRPLLMPAMFFVTYGAIGNALSHTTWAVLVGGYFPGLITGIGYLVIGPLLLRRVWPGATWRQVLLFFAALLVTMTPLQVLLAESG